MDTGDLHDAYTVRSLDDLAKIYAKPLPKIANKETDHITAVGRAFIAASLLATWIDIAQGRCAGLRAAARRSHPADPRPSG